MIPTNSSSGHTTSSELGDSERYCEAVRARSCSPRVCESLHWKRRNAEEVYTTLTFPEMKGGRYVGKFVLSNACDMRKATIRMPGTNEFETSSGSTEVIMEVNLPRSATSRRRLACFVRRNRSEELRSSPSVSSQCETSGSPNSSSSIISLLNRIVQNIQVPFKYNYKLVCWEFYLGKVL